MAWWRSGRVAANVALRDGDSLETLANRLKGDCAGIGDLHKQAQKL